ncbi:MAG: FHA domain-containing protein [Chloroflexi bacterium]|nr:MAG: FHA domain-containing protein [Chloroflexota bacterium]
MSFICPRGHHSVSDDYCSVCGVRNPGSPVMAGVRNAREHMTGESMCLVCGVQRDGTDRYCVNCGYDFEMGEPFVPEPEPQSNGYAPAPAHAPAPAQAPSVATHAPAVSAGPAAPSLVLLASVNTMRFDDPGSPPPPVDLSERTFILDRHSIVIGREGGSLDIPIHGDPYISRRHAEIVWMGSAWGIRDLGSTNGTRVNGVPLEGSEVKLLGPDDVIELGFFSQLMVRGLTGEGQ